MVGKKQTALKTAALMRDGPGSVDMRSSLARALKNPLKAPRADDNGGSQDLRFTLRSIESSFYLVDQVRDVLVEACHLVLRANAIEDPAGRALLAEQYDELRQSIQRLVDGADEEASALVGSQAKGIVAQLTPISTYSVLPSRLSLDENSLDLPAPVQGFSQTGEIGTILGKLDNALETLDRIAASYMKDAQYLMTKLGQ